ncbi:LLM class F420-dependent oxidoreductase [Virgisporangium ochraceum]|jgi:F420-dependent oxidoreductase-like protein|uniref:LLM class F420-dependent oxidoreductase n=1 Tax=Virgisporangium ochraceum TaxID=65505 RepID=A0A8J3ZW08_9ACTN|nr:LLM class F420-dependent oxidoreductase [Virgisporangium ochraceum]GIJ69465.1 LLM class F420-dependent oxidoreductase [Virgisporangium ochraceum]
MRLCVFIEPQMGATYEDQLAVARRAEECGFDAFFRSDHFLTMGRDGLPGPTDSWVTLGALARETSTIRLGTLVTSATFRLPGPLAIAVAQVDRMSGGRVDFGLGTGWFEAEHTAYGIPFPPVAERFDRLEEQLEIITGLWAADKPYSFTGRHYTLVDSPALPKPVQQPVPVIVGGTGARRTPALAARFASEYNVPFSPLAKTRECFDRVRAVAERPLVLSMAQTVSCGRDAAEIRRRVEAGGRMAENGLQGTPSELVDRLAEFGEAGATRAFLQILDLSDLDHLDLIAEEVLPQLR